MFWLHLIVDFLTDGLFLLHRYDPPLTGDPPRRHPYESRTALRMRLPSPLVKLGIARKGRDCEAVSGRHLWYDHDGMNSACYHCRVVRPGQLWNRSQFSGGQNQ